MNAFEYQLKALVKCLSEQKIKYVVIGGVAVCVYGEPRYTADTDVNIQLDKAEIMDFLENSKRYGFYPGVPNPEEFIRKTGVIPMNFKRGEKICRYDIIIAENVLEYAAIKRGRSQKVGSVRVMMVSPEDLIIYKITSSRPRDIEDLRGILIRQKDKLNTRYIEDWLKKIDKTDKTLNLHRLFCNLVSELN